MERRKFLTGMATVPFIMKTGLFEDKSTRPGTPSDSLSRVKMSVNAYSFNTMLRSGEMSFVDMMEFAADTGLDAVDMTGYYFSNYPSPPADSEIFEFKRKALQLGIDIPWTGVRNDFVNPDDEARKADRDLVRAWLKVSSKLGASIMRVFAGKDKPAEYSRVEAMSRLIDELKICAGYSQEEGVMIGLQHHNDFLYTSDEIIEVLQQVDSKWLGLILDVGSLHKGDSYMEMRKLAPYASYWFIKEHVYPNGEKTPVNMKKIAEIIKGSNYRGYVSFESLSEGDPKEIVTAMVKDFRIAFQAMS
ncbi:MAG: sugar phosphate isomerase/epimerase family protein [Bacteroidales bacterium]